MKTKKGDNMSRTEMGELMKRLRLERGLTLEEVGQRVGVGKSTVRKWENGDIANMRRDKIALVAKALGVAPAYLMGWTDDPTADYYLSHGIAARGKSAEWNATLADIEHSRALGALDALQAEDERAVMEVYHNLTEAQKRRFKRLLEIIKEDDSE